MHGLIYGATVLTPPPVKINVYSNCPPVFLGLFSRFARAEEVFSCIQHLLSQACPSCSTPWTPKKTMKLDRILYYVLHCIDPTVPSDNYMSTRREEYHCPWFSFWGVAVSDVSVVLRNRRPCRDFTGLGGWRWSKCSCKYLFGGGYSISNNCFEHFDHRPPPKCKLGVAV